MPAKRIKKTKSKFEIEAPDAESVLLVGEFTDWETGAITLKKNKSGKWKTSVSLAEGNHQYRFLVDGEWCDDPSATGHVPNPFGSQNCVRNVNSA